MKSKEDNAEDGFDVHETWQTLQSLREFAHGEYGDEHERVWITRQEARIITDLIWLIAGKVLEAKEQCDEK